jgi:hypothetical protein
LCARREPSLVRRIFETGAKDHSPTDGCKNMEKLGIEPRTFST